MGWGDEIIATGEARHAQEVYGPIPVAICDRGGHPRWHAAWQNNPRIVRPEHVKPEHLRITHASYARPYVDWERMRSDFAKVFPGKNFTTKGIRDERLPWRFTDAKVKRGELYLGDIEKRGYVVIEPHHKAIQVNRDWGWHKYQKLVDSLPLDWVQINPAGAKILNGVRHLPGNDFLSAARLLGAASCYVGPEGGLYHAAAALGVRSVAIFGGYVPLNQGYSDCINLGEGPPCGQRVECAHCREVMSRISVDTLVAHVAEFVREG